mmetsp:Transcript_17686/g.42422  ORF Transcript_17686/g.42422 Transcript_17686/m.42422 type:complete len:312 (-) Transcript_17686:635-1570(-)
MGPWRSRSSARRGFASSTSARLWASCDCSSPQTVRRYRSSASCLSRRVTLLPLRSSSLATLAITSKRPPDLAPSSKGLPESRSSPRDGNLSRASMLLQLPMRLRPSVIAFRQRHSWSPLGGWTAGRQLPLRWRRSSRGSSPTADSTPPQSESSLSSRLRCLSRHSASAGAAARDVIPLPFRWSSRRFVIAGPTRQICSHETPVLLSTSTESCAIPWLRGRVLPVGRSTLPVKLRARRDGRQSATSATCAQLERRFPLRSSSSSTGQAALSSAAASPPWSFPAILTPKTPTKRRLATFKFFKLCLSASFSAP